MRLPCNRRAIYMYPSCHLHVAIMPLRSNHFVFRQQIFKNSCTPAPCAVTQAVTLENPAPTGAGLTFHNTIVIEYFSCTYRCRKFAHKSLIASARCRGAGIFHIIARGVAHLAFQNGPSCLSKRPILEVNMCRFTFQYAPYCHSIWA